MVIVKKMTQNNILKHRNSFNKHTMLIGFLGKKGVGKDTCADYLVDKCGYVKKSFADPLKAAAKELFLFSDDQLYGSIKSKETPDPRWFGCTPRTVLQYVGTNLLRDQLETIIPDLEKNIFTHHFKLWYEEQKQKNPDIKIVIADVRFQNEVDVIHSLGGIIIKIVRNVDNTDDLHSTHASETELEAVQNFDYIIPNSSTIDDLQNSLISLTSKLQPSE